MISRVIIFDDEPDDLRGLKDEMAAIGCDVITIDHNNSKDVLKQKTTLDFKPQLAIVDSKFEADIDGMGIVKDLNKTFPGIKIIICTILFDLPQKKKWIEDQYKDVKGVCAVIGKKEFPTGKQIVDLCSN
jgi:DNA-binding NtrC family response regulator